jgi:hypothetical protein
MILLLTIKCLFLKKNGLKKICRKNYKNNPRSNIYECTAAVHCFQNILDDMVLENVNLSSDKIGGPPFVV